MSVLPIRLWPDPVLRHSTKKVVDFDDRLKLLVEDMLETMYDAPGVGLAAPQVGVERQILVYDAGEGEMALINPEITAKSGSEVDEEGCLSVPGLYYPVERAAQITVVAFDPTGDRITADLEGYEARVVQHETDHLNGVMFMDRLDPDTRREAMSVMRERLLSNAAPPPGPKRAVL